MMFNNLKELNDVDSLCKHMVYDTTDLCKV